MPRERSDKRAKAKEIYDEHNGQISNREIAGILDCSEKTVSGWKCKDNWSGNNRSTPNENDRSTPKKRGGQPDNQNAKGKNLGNQNARKHGLYSKYIPPELIEIIEEMPKDPLDVVWQGVEIQYARVIHAQNIMHVLDKEDKTTELTFKGDSLGYEIQQAWDKEANAIKAQSRAMGTLMSMIKDYDVLLHRNWDTATEIQKARLAQIQAQTDKLRADSDKNEQDQLSKVDKILQEIQEDAKSKTS